MKLEFFIGADDELGTAGTFDLAKNIATGLMLENALIKNLNRCSYHGNLIGWLSSDQFEVDYSLNIDTIGRLIYNGPAAVPDNVTQVMVRLGVTEYTLSEMKFDLTVEMPLSKVTEWLPNATIKEIIQFCIADGGQTFSGSRWQWQLRQIITERLMDIQDNHPEEVDMDYMWLKNAFW